MKMRMAHGESTHIVRRPMKTRTRGLERRRKLERLHGGEQLDGEHALDILHDLERLARRHAAHAGVVDKMQTTQG